MVSSHTVMRSLKLAEVVEITVGINLPYYFSCYFTFLPTWIRLMRYLLPIYLSDFHHLRHSFEKGNESLCYAAQGIVSVCHEEFSPVLYLIYRRLVGGYFSFQIFVRICSLLKHLYWICLAMFFCSFHNLSWIFNCTEFTWIVWEKRRAFLSIGFLTPDVHCKQ